MRFEGKKFIFSIFVPLLLLSCGEIESFYEEDESAPNVKYSDDWKYITLYLEGASAPLQINPSQRAMTVDTARRGFDYFEVFFYYSGTFATAVWEIGKRASIKDIYRTSGGIDYSATSISVSNACALLFAGRKEDKTLLALGKLIYVNNVPSTVVTDKSVSVTFELSTLTGGVNVNPAASSFLTAAKVPPYTSVSSAGTDVINAAIGGRAFPLYRLPRGELQISASYYFDLASVASNGNITGGKWSSYVNSVFVAAKGTAWTREVRYPAGSGKYYYPQYKTDLTTKVKMENNQTAGTVLQPTVTFKFDTSMTVNHYTEENGIFSFYFEIPVCAIRYSEGVSTWYIRPAYQSYLYNIDNGMTQIVDPLSADRNIGGAVLLGVDAPFNFEISAQRR